MKLWRSENLRDSRTIVVASSLSVHAVPSMILWTGGMGRSRELIFLCACIRKVSFGFMGGFSTPTCWRSVPLLGTGLVV